MTQERIQSGGQEQNYTSEPTEAPSLSSLRASSDKDVRVIHGPNEYPVPVAGKTVGEVRRQLKDFLNLPEQCDAIIGDEKVDDDFVLTPNTAIEFNKSTGTKGMEKPLLTIEQLEEDDPQAYQFVTQLVMEFAKHLYAQGDPEVRAMGLEKSFETIIELLDNGIFKLRFDQSTDDYMLCRFNPEVGDYSPIESFSV